jgi:hypothetical protein
MSLETGTYIITNRITNGVVAGAYDLSPLSKVVTFPGGVEEPGVSSPYLFSGTCVD